MEDSGWVNSAEANERAGLWVRRWRQARQFYQPLFTKYERELNFALKLDHWDDDQPGQLPTTKDNSRFRGRELYSKCRRMTADVMQAKREVAAIPRDAGTDPKAASAGKFVVSYYTESPDFGFDTFLERGVVSAICARIGYIAIEWDGRVNELIFRNPDPRRCMPAPGWQDIWDRRLPYFMEQVPMRLSDAQEAWPEANLVADLAGSDLDQGIARQDTVNAQQAIPEKDPNVEGRCLALLCWSQFDPETTSVVVGQRQLQPEEQYAHCPQCGYKSDMPEMAGMACPDCLRNPGSASTLELATGEAEIADLPRYPKGRVFEVVFPLQNKCVERGPWPTGPNGETLRTPPYVMIRRSEHPFEICGLSETTVDANMQSISNQLMERVRKIVQGPMSALGVYGEPEDAEGNPWQPTDDPFQMIYFPDPAQAQSLRIQQLADVSPALFNMIQMVQEQFRADLGTFELSAQSAQDVKGVAVGTVEQAAQSGSVPTDHLIKRIRADLARGYGLICDWARIMWTPGRWVRTLGDLGMTNYQLLAAADIPNVDFVFTDESDKAWKDQREFQGAMQWYQTGLPQMGGSPALRRALAAAGVAPVSQDLVEQIESAEADAAEAQLEAMRAGGAATPPDAAGMGAPGMTPTPGPEAGAPAGQGMAPDQLAAMMGARGMA